jgi:hypothetical protein
MSPLECCLLNAPRWERSTRIRKAHKEGAGLGVHQHRRGGRSRCPSSQHDRGKRWVKRATINPLGRDVGRSFVSKCLTWKLRPHGGPSECRQRCNSSAGRARWGSGVRRDGTILGLGSRRSCHEQASQSMTCQVSVRGNRKNKHELHSNGVNDGSECEDAKMRRRCDPS